MQLRESLQHANTTHICVRACVRVCVCVCRCVWRSCTSVYTYQLYDAPGEEYLTFPPPPFAIMYTSMYIYQEYRGPIY
jgi:hypothetical protein